MVKIKNVVWILVLIGIVIPAWTACGSIPYLIQLGLAWVNPAWFLTCCFLLSSLMSLLLGTSLGTLSSLGIPLMGVGAAFQIPAALTAGALVSGAMVGDRSSPLSSAAQLTATIVETDINTHLRAIMPTLVAGAAITAAGYGVLDMLTRSGQTEWMMSYPFAKWFRLMPLLSLPPLVLVVGTLARLGTRPVFLASTIAALLLGTGVQAVSLTAWPAILWGGFQGTDLAVLHGRGLLQMLPLAMFIALTGAFNGILQESRAIEPYIRTILGNRPGMLNASLRVGAFGLAMNLIACNQTLPIMVTGANFAPLWRQRFPLPELGRVIADTGLIFAAMIPWNMLAIVAGSILGVDSFHYLPGALFLWLMPLATCYRSWILAHQSGDAPA